MMGVSSSCIKGEKWQNTVHPLLRRFIPARAGEGETRARHGVPVRFIPARAGETIARLGGRGGVTVHPRACGGRPDGPASSYGGGSSPPTRPAILHNQLSPPHARG